MLEMTNGLAIKILIIDDDMEDTEMFTHAVAEVAPHVSCHAVNNPTRALSYLMENQIQPEYIFLDANMFLIDGKECLQQLRKLHWLNNTRIIMYSGYISESQVAEFKQLGADEYLHKPHSYEQLRSSLHALFSKRTVAQ
jgi:DNA-binding response OmpR family regulator